jgi:hypothetical protein
MGSAAAAAAPLLHAEVARRRRHNAQNNVWSSTQVRDDEALLRACERALAAVSSQ